jgi:SAM-dependent MidA family methyltransferase
MPALDGAQHAHAQAVLAVLRARIGARGGWIGFDEYLELVLYAPGLGYYSAGAAKFGPAGDFVTAPELSPLFGACVARACAPLLAGGGEILELGAGSGALAEAVLLRLAELDALPARYAILEVSADLRERQCARLDALPPELRARLHWLDALPPRRLRGVILANEVADALPFQCFAATAGGYAERGVALDEGGHPRWAERPAAPALHAELAALAASLPAPPAVGYRGELCLRLDPWIRGLAGVLESGGILLFDYGLGRRELYHPQRDAGTLRCHYRHRAMTTRSGIRACRTSPPGWTSRGSQRPRQTRACKWRATARRQPFCSAPASMRNWRAVAMRSNKRAAQPRRGSCCCRAKWARPSRPCC